MAKKTDNAVAVTDEPAGALVAADYGEYATLGFEGHSQDDYSIPFIGVLQSNSPIVAEEDAEARPGMILNTVTGDLYKGSEGVRFIPVVTQHNYVEWRPRDAGGGFVSVRDLDDPEVERGRAQTKVGKILNPAGNELVETFSVYGLVVNPDGTSAQAVIAFTSTKIKKYRHWMTKARTIQIPVNGRRIPAPLPAHVYRLKTVKEKNTKGEFYNWDIGFDGPDALSSRLAPDSDLFQEAVSFNNAVKGGLVKAAHASQDKVGSEAGGGSSATTADDEVPF